MNLPLVSLLALLALTGGLVVALQPFTARWSDGTVLKHPAAPWIIGCLTALSCWWVAGATLRVEPISTDEAAYLFQARIFAHGAVTAPAPPIPEFFEQSWVVVTPRMYAKYPPGQALVLTPGVWLGLPWLMPLCLNAIAGGLLFALLRRAFGAAAALLTWVAWILSTMAMSWQSTYFSEVTLMACWLVAAAAVWRWYDGGRAAWLVGAAAAAGFGVVTRPLSIVLLTLPLAGVVALSLRRSRRWRDLTFAALTFGAMLMFLPAWDLATTGAMGRSPLREYTETYLPWDRLGFAIESTAARRPPPPDLAFIAPQLLRVHREHTIARLPWTLAERAAQVARSLFGGWRVLFPVATVLGLWVLGRVGWLICSAALLQFLGHAVWGHEAGWTLYYAESAPLWYLPGALGIVVALRRLGGPGGSAERAAARAELAVLLAAPLLLGLSVLDSRPYREWRAGRAGTSRALTEAIAAGPGHGIYFVRYGTAPEGRPGLIRNDPWLAGARDWVVYDLGARNEELLRAAPGRTGYLVDVAGRRVIPLAAAP